MSQGVFLLAAQPIQDLWTNRIKNAATGLQGMSLFYWALIAVVVAVFVWAVFIRKPEEDRHRERHWRDRQPGTGTHHKSRRAFGIGPRRHRRKRKERPRNPTLAETGGLPPPRPDDVAPPGH